MAEENDDREKTDQGEAKPTKKSNNPTWVGVVLKTQKEAADAQIAAHKEASEDKEAFIRERLEAEATERDKRSKTLYDIAQERSTEQQVTIRRLWIGNILQGLIIAALAGKTVGLTIPGFGDVSMSNDKPAAEEPVPAPKD